jgi:hypothetical protein
LLPVVLVALAAALVIRLQALGRNAMLATLERGRRTIPRGQASESKLARCVTPCGEHLSPTDPHPVILPAREILENHILTRREKNL